MGVMWSEHQQTVYCNCAEILLVVEDNMTFSLFAVAFIIFFVLKGQQFRNGSKLHLVSVLVTAAMYLYLSLKSCCNKYSSQWRECIYVFKKVHGFHWDGYSILGSCICTRCCDGIVISVHLQSRNFYIQVRCERLQELCQFHRSQSISRDLSNVWLK